MPKNAPPLETDRWSTKNCKTCQKNTYAGQPLRIRPPASRSWIVNQECFAPLFFEEYVIFRWSYLRPAVNRQPGYRRVDSQSGYKQTALTKLTQNKQTETTTYHETTQRHQHDRNNERTNEKKRTNERTNKRTNERTNERTKKCTHERTNAQANDHRKT